MGEESQLIAELPILTIEEVDERRMLAKLTSIMENICHSLYETVGSLSSSFSSRLIHPQCKKDILHSICNQTGTADHKNIHFIVRATYILF